MAKRDWKIVYTNYSGMEKKAVELLSSEVGAITIRDKGVYTLHVVPCEKVGCETDKNIIMVGRYDENELIRKIIKREEIPKNGFAVKVCQNPENENFKIAVITGMTDREVFYGAVDFVDNYIPYAAPSSKSNPLRYVEKVFDKEVPDYFNASAPQMKTRSIFTWGHPINDIRKYIENAARLRINQIIIWNDFLPLNAEEIVNYAHEYGIEIMWGFPWGWDTSFEGITKESLVPLKDKIVKEFKEVYNGIGDGIYFQSFTELDKEYLGGMLIAEAVTEFVNEVSAEIFKIRPDIHLQFGLHARSVKNHLDHIAKVDPRIEIVWEDCGTFPSGYRPIIDDEAEYEKTVEFASEIAKLRKDGATGYVYKGLMTMDWDIFVHQSGPFVLGKNSKTVIENDIEMLTPIWRDLQSEWMTYGKYVHDFTRRLHKVTGSDLNICMAGALDGAIWLPMAICAELMWSSEDEYDKIINRILKRSSVKTV